jgi:hypothetical protein
MLDATVSFGSGPAVLHALQSAGSPGVRHTGALFMSSGVGQGGGATVTRARFQ